MPEYLAPGVYVEETSFRSKSIEGVGTSTTGFAGPTRKGPVGGTPEILTSFGDFERIYGGQDTLGFADPINYMAPRGIRVLRQRGIAAVRVARLCLRRRERRRQRLRAFGRLHERRCGDGQTVDLSGPLSRRRRQRRYRCDRGPDSGHRARHEHGAGGHPAADWAAPMSRPAHGLREARLRSRCRMTPNYC